MSWVLFFRLFCLFSLWRYSRILHRKLPQSLWYQLFLGMNINVQLYLEFRWAVVVVVFIRPLWLWQRGRFDHTHHHSDCACVGMWGGVIRCRCQVRGVETLLALSLDLPLSLAHSFRSVDLSVAVFLSVTRIHILVVCASLFDRGFDEALLLHRSNDTTLPCTLMLSSWYDTTYTN